ncbi:MAG: hypothetical protein ACOYOV_11360 [Bacteroidales bacterium]
MMNYKESELQTIEELAALFFKPSEIAIVLEINAEEFVAEIKLEEGEAYRRYKKGWLTSEIELRKSVFESATNGSNPAQNMMLDYNKNNRYA